MVVKIVMPKLGLTKKHNFIGERKKKSKSYHFNMYFK